jgi:hypothetical protein
MLYNQEEIEIIKNAQEPGIRNPLRPRIHFDRIMSRFFKNYDFQDKVILDLGPGHYDFCELARQKGADSHAIELDECVVRLGQYKKFKVIKGNLINPSVFDSFEGKVDLLFCRGSINCTWFNDNYEQEKYIEKMLSTLKFNGSAWISPCNESDSLSHYQSSLKTQMDVFEKLNFHTFKLHKVQAYMYGIWSDNPKLIYTKNLKYHKFPW